MPPRFAHRLPLVLHADGYLSGKLDAAQSELDPQRFFVDGFQKAGTEEPVHLDRGTDHTVGKLVELRPRLHQP